MKTTTKPCTNGPRHTWTWAKNTTTARIGANTARFSLRGLYRCACGQQKAGPANHNGPDLRELVTPSSTTTAQP